VALTEDARRDSFVVRIWHEPGRPGWRGWVQHAGGGESATFEHWQELLAFLERWVEVVDEPRQPGLR
jgi:hypothetical protein